jgi:hypothetical protein
MDWLRKSAVPILSQIVPIRIDLLYQRDFPSTLPALQVCLATDRIGIKRILLEIDETRHAVFLAKFRAAPFTMRKKTPMQVRCYADIQRAISLACEDVNNSTRPRHGGMLEQWMAGSSPAMVRVGDDFRSETPPNKAHTKRADCPPARASFFRLRRGTYPPRSLESPASGPRRSSTPRRPHLCFATDWPRKRAVSPGRNPARNRLSAASSTARAARPRPVCRRDYALMSGRSIAMFFGR